jgi:protein-tyrosine phosphatase
MERLLVARLLERLPLTDVVRFGVRSSGTGAVVGAGMSRNAAKALVALGGDPTGFAARELNVELIRAADLILTAAREHRRFVVAAEPRAAGWTLTLREFARLLGPVRMRDIDRRASTDDPVERMAAVAAVALANRGLVPPTDLVKDDITDPYQRRRAAYRRAARDIDDALAVPLGFVLRS